MVDNLRRQANSSRSIRRIGLCGATGALLSSPVLYVSYRPYAEILPRFIQDGDETGLIELSNFLDTTQLPLGAQGFPDLEKFVFYFGFGGVLLRILALPIAVLRHFQHCRRANATI